MSGSSKAVAVLQRSATMDFGLQGKHARYAARAKGWALHVPMCWPPKAVNRIKSVTVATVNVSTHYSSCRRLRRAPLNQRQNS